MAETAVVVVESVVAVAELAIAVAAILALRQTRGEIAANREASERAERHLLEERARQATQRLAEQELQRVQVLAEMTGGWTQHIHYNALETGRMRAALDALPPDHLPLTEAFWFSAEEDRLRVFADEADARSEGNIEVTMLRRRELVRHELAEHMRCLVDLIAIGESDR